MGLFPIPVSSCQSLEVCQPGQRHIMKKTCYFMHSPIHSGSKGMLQILGVKITQPCKSHQLSKNPKGFGQGSPKCGNLANGHPFPNPVWKLVKITQPCKPHKFQKKSKRVWQGMSKVHLKKIRNSRATVHCQILTHAHSKIWTV